MGLLLLDALCARVWPVVPDGVFLLLQGAITDLRLACYVTGMTKPLYLSITGEVLGLHVTYTTTSSAALPSAYVLSMPGVYTKCALCVYTQCARCVYIQCRQ